MDWKLILKDGQEVKLPSVSDDAFEDHIFGIKEPHLYGCSDVEYRKFCENENSEDLWDYGKDYLIGRTIIFNDGNSQYVLKIEAINKIDNI